MLLLLLSMAPQFIEISQELLAIIIIITWVAVVGVVVAWEDVAFKAEVDRDETAVDVDLGGDIIALHDNHRQRQEEQVGVRRMEEGKCLVERH